MFDALKSRLGGVFAKLRGKGKLTEEDVQEALREVRRALLEADVNYKVVKDLVENIRVRAVEKSVLESITPGQQVIGVVYEELMKLMGKDPKPISISSKPPTIVMMVGLQGGGKTTSTVKIAKKLSRGHRPLVVACDLRRPAAVDQLKVLAEAAGVGFLGPEPGDTDVMAVVRRAKDYAKDRLLDVILFDTAGRLAVDQEMMAELDGMKEYLSPHEILLVVDSMSGQEAVTVSEAFHERLGLTGVVLTKVDGDARGGAALAVLASTGVPIKYAGVGEAIDAIEVFDARRMAERIMGMGDVAGLVEKIQQATTEEDVKRISSSVKKNKLDFNDLLAQFEQIEKMGPLEKVIEMIPGADKIKELKDGELDPSRMARMRAIIQSMTPDERRNPAIIKGSRRRRIAQGSGTTIQMVNQLLKQQTQMNDLWKKMGKGAGRKRFQMPKFKGFSGFS
ncbi:signal recognition particle protein [Dethiosulfovibrio salsuginis]|uniref:Signal recognition particle protein n=1 Tax=Dethiosulfovibrio salsuginis TaxID=561720 RepID=A0A1X7L374_9BACT|nr:signal recognition particle protein [Dethiosulfovibrio salsuginis]SMG48097.1 signal recognition particle subunit FFH/SRP54 (srp54) [Dethiosulfovibrio salsuginis]